MSEPMRFPKNPLEGFQDRFQDEQGRNPYADENAAPVETNNNIFAAPASDNEPVYQPKYEEILPHRANLATTMAVLGLFFAVVSGVASYWRDEALVLFVCNLALTVPGWMMARSDYRAMLAGAMQQDGGRRTAIAMYLAMVATLLTLATMAVRVFVGVIWPMLSL